MWRVAASALVAGLAAAAPGGAAVTAPAPVDPPTAVVAAFGRISYAAGATAALTVRRAPRRLTVRLFRVGFEARRPQRNDLLVGVPVSPAVQYRWAQRQARRVLRLQLGEWPSGFYFAELTGSGRIGFAPFVLRPRKLGRARVAVVLPTNTWQAYNFRDDNRDGVGDTWYANPQIPSVDLTRPFLNRGVPPNFRGYDRAFIRWLAQAGKSPDFLTDDDLETIAAGDRLARLYDLVVFSGHHEYVTAHVFDLVERYRNLGGNLAFLSANNFFYRVERRGSRLYRMGRWRDIGRWTAPTFGVEYVGWMENRYPNRPYVVTARGADRWLFEGTGLGYGARFGCCYGIEVDATSQRSPPGTRVLARISGIFGPGRSAEMAYSTTRRGAKVFSAGVLNFGGSAENPVVRRMLENLWVKLTKP